MNFSYTDDAKNDSVLENTLSFKTLRQLELKKNLSENYVTQITK